MHQRGLAGARIVGLRQGIHHQTRDQLITAVNRRIPVGAVIAVLHDQVFFGEAL
ncbi:Uncharacterised protein [Mycobacteroides abscessus subsp. abscessus]|nr:Uncharacterised protein [Mycobacteroides abscessus subsp. abscessus]